MMEGIRSRGPARYISISLAFIILMVFSCTIVHALDYEDLRELVRSQVPNTAIINVVQQTNLMEITGEQAEELRSLGASQDLLDVLTVPLMPFDDIRQLVASGVPEQAILNVIRQHQIYALTSEEEEELRALGASEDLIAFIVGAYDLAERDDQAVPGDGTGTVMTLDDLQGSTEHESVYSGDNLDSYYVQEPPTIYSAPEYYYYDDTPYYGGGVFIYPDYGYRRRRRPSRPPPPPPARPRPPPPPVRPRPPQIQPPRPVEPPVRPRPPQGVKPPHGGRPRPGEGSRPSRPKPPPPVNPGRPGGNSGQRPKPENVRPSRPAPSDHPVVNRPEERRSRPPAGSNRGQGGGRRSTGRASPIVTQPVQP